MKNKVKLAIALVLGLMLAGCGGQGETGGYALSGAQALVDAGAFSEQLEQLDGDTAFALYRLADYGLSREELEDCAVLRSAGATCEEAAFLQIGGGEDQAEQAAQALRDYVSAQIDANRDYRPAEIPKLEAALVDRAGQVVVLVVASDMDAARAALAAG